MMALARDIDSAPRRRAYHRGFRRAAAWLRAMRRAVRERRMLARMDERMLKDIGVTPAMRDAEVGRPFWDLPQRLRHEIDPTTLIR